MINFVVEKRFARALRDPNRKAALLGGFSLETVEQALTRAAELTLQETQATQPLGLSLVLSDDAHLRELNRQFLGVDAPTDVLAFPSGEVDPHTQNLYLGDVILSLSRAQEQAVAAGHTLLDELQLLTVHGVLHLLGYNHEEPEEQQVMEQTQASLLRKLKNSWSG